MQVLAQLLLLPVLMRVILLLIDAINDAISAWCSDE
jgi:hypothetical protein